jgi:flagellar protein FlaI
MVMTRTEIDGKPARRAATTTEIIGLDQKSRNVQTNEIFHWQPREDTFTYSGQSKILEENMKKLGVDEEEVKQELRRRRTVLEWMANSGIRRHTEVANIIREYYANANRVFQKARVGMK